MRALLHIAFLLSLALPLLAAPSVSNLRLAADKAPCYGRVEVTCDLQATFDNPFDPAQVTLDGLFTGPGGLKVTMPGFLYRAYTRSLDDNGREQIAPAGEPVWMVRFCPTKPGAWQARLTVTDKTGTATSAPIAFTVTPSKSHGFLRRSPDPRYFQYEDGTPVTLIGENIAWASRGGSHDFDAWLTAAGKAGLNFARIWLQWDSTLSLETKQSGAGRYDLGNAWRMDHVLDVARDSGVKVLFCCDSPEPYQKEHYWLGKLTAKPWENCPHNVANGGPLNTPEEFYTTDAGHELIRRRLRYIIARWGFDSNIMCWELWNELNCFPGWANLIPQIADWHREMAATVRKLDPNRHLITTSFGNAYGEDTIWKVPELDFVQSHLYGFSRIGTVYPSVTQDMQHRYGRPHVVGEFGPKMEELSPMPQTDPTGLNLRDGIWSTMLGGGAAAAMTWCWDFYVHKLNLYSVYQPLVRFCQGIDWPREGFQPVAATVKWVTPPPPSPPRDLVLPCGGAGLPQLYGRFVIDLARPPDGLGRVYLYGKAQSDQQKPICFDVNLPRPSQFILNIGRVWVEGILEVKLDGKPVLREVLPAGPPGAGPWKKAEFSTQWNIWAADYDRDLTFDLPAGKHTLELYNAGRDGITIDRITLTGCLTDDRPAVNVVGLAGKHLTVLWVQNKASDWFSLAEKKPIEPVSGAAVTVPGIPAGACTVEWWDTQTGKVTAREKPKATREGLMLKLPALASDVAVKVRY